MLSLTNSINSPTIKSRHHPFSHHERENGTVIIGHQKTMYIVRVYSTLHESMKLISTEHTLSLLFSAQQSSRPQFESPVQHPPIESIPQINQSHTQQPSLHAFWQLPKGRRTSLSSITSPSFLISNSDPLPYISQTTNCEDCDASLSSDDTDAADIDIMMDVDNVGGTSYACTRCSKPVCSRCAISNLGKERKCLGCAGRGLEWMDGMDRSGLRNDFGYVITLE